MYKWPHQSGRLYCKTRVSSFVNLKTGKMDWYFLVINIAPKYNDIVWRVVEMTFLKDYFDGLFSPKLVCVYVNKTGQPISVGCQWYMIIDRVFAWLSFVFRCSLACFRGRLCRLIFIPIFLFFSWRSSLSRWAWSADLDTSSCHCWFGDLNLSLVLSHLSFASCRLRVFQYQYPIAGLSPLSNLSSRSVIVFPHLPITGRA